MTPLLLIVGHLVKDITANGWEPGGGVLYAAAQAQRLGIDTAIVTACDDDIDPPSLLPGVRWHVVPLSHCIEFENRYDNGARQQHVKPVDRQIKLDDIPASFLDAPLVLLAPVFDDVDPALPAQLARNHRTVGLGAQGWLRRIGSDCTVHPGAIDRRPVWLVGDTVFLSSEDVVNAELAAGWQDTVSNVILTRGRDGYTFWQAGQRHDISTIPVLEKDPTGAGDVFAVAFLIRYYETADALEAARFAAVAAAFSVEGPGLESIASRETIEARLSSIRVTA